MSYEILIHPRVAKAIKDLPKAHKLRLSEFMRFLRIIPFLSGDLI